VNHRHRLSVLDSPIPQKAVALPLAVLAVEQAEL